MRKDPLGTALITGASAGIGAATARELIGSGWKVICTARRTDRLDQLVSELGTNAIALSLDVTDKQSVSRLVDRLPDQWREIDVLVNNAGMDLGGRQRFDRGAVDDWAMTIETNVIGVMRVTHAIAQGMISRRRGHIVNIGSVFGLVSHEGSVAYCTSKHAVNGFSKAILDDFRSQGLRVTQILPGVTRTEFSDARWRGDEAKVKAFYGQFEQVLEATDVARMVSFALAQPAHVTISDLVIVPSS